MLLAMSALCTFSKAQSVDFVSSNLPIMVINTEGKMIMDHPKVDVKMGIIDNGAGNRNFYKNPNRNNQPDSFNNFDGIIGIEHRGSSSQFFPKKPYGFEIRNGLNTDGIDASLLGMPEESDWILNASFTDKSLLRNVFTHHLANQMGGMYATRTRFLELVLDGDYRGVYVLMEKIKRNVNRVNIAKLKDTDNSGDDVTGGYILKVDKNSGTANAQWRSPYPANHNYEINIMVEYPKKVDITNAQLNYIQNHFTEFEHTLKGPNFKDPTNGYAKYIDVNSWVDYFLLTEVTYNIDAFRLSIFFYKDKDSRNSKIKMGPPWDYDHSFGNANFCRGWEPNHWAYNFVNEFCPNEDKQVPFWWARLMEDEAFRIKVRDRWQQLRQNQWSDVNLNGFINQNVALLNEAQQRNFQRWPILGQYQWPAYQWGNTYGEEVSIFTNFLQQRLAWLDENIPKLVNTNCNTALPTAPTTVSFCQSQAAQPLTASGTALKWYSGESGGEGSTTAPTPNTNNIGTSNYYVSQTINGCESGRLKIEVNVNSKLGKPSVSNTTVSYCQGAAATALSASGISLKWYTAPFGGEGTTDAPTPSTATVGLVSYFVSQGGGNCESDRTQINVYTKNKPGKPDVIASVGYCQGVAASPLAANGTNLLWYTSAESNTGQTGVPTPSTASATNTSFFVTQTIDGCESDKAKIDVSVNPRPDTPSFSGGTSFCQNQTATALSVQGQNILWYATYEGGTGTATAPTPSTATPGTPVYFATQTINGCESARLRIELLINATPSLPLVTPTINYTKGQTPSLLSATGSNLRWYNSPNDAVGNTSAPMPSTETVGMTSYFVSQSNGPCESQRAQIQVFVREIATTNACLQIKVLLEGAKEGSAMSTKLNQYGLLPGQTPTSSFGTRTPSGQPYRAAPWNYDGDEQMTNYSPEVVDWVLVSLRTSPHEPATTIYRTAALLHADGTIKTIKACPSFKADDSYYVVVEHRNHLGVVSHQKVSIVGEKMSYDFSKQQSYISPDALGIGQKKIGSGFYLYAADADKSSFSEINASDGTVWRNHNGKFNLYQVADFNLDGEINAHDASLWRVNNGNFSSVRF